MRCRLALRQRQAAHCLPTKGLENAAMLAVYCSVFSFSLLRAAYINRTAALIQARYPAACSGAGELGIRHAFCTWRRQDDWIVLLRRRLQPQEKGIGGETGIGRALARTQFGIAIAALQSKNLVVVLPLTAGMAAWCRIGSAAAGAHLPFLPRKRNQLICSRSLPRAAPTSGVLFVLPLYPARAKSGRAAATSSACDPRRPAGSAVCSGFGELKPLAACWLEKLSGGGGEKAWL